MELDDVIVFVHLQEITLVAEQRRQMIKRIEPLAEENEKHKEAKTSRRKISRGPDVKETLRNPTRGTWNTKRGS